MGIFFGRSGIFIGSLDLFIGSLGVLSSEPEIFGELAGKN